MQLASGYLIFNKSEVALEDLIKKTSRSAKLPKPLRNTKMMLLVQSSDAIKKIRSRHKYTEHDCTASLAYAESQESQACTCHLG